MEYKFTVFTPAFNRAHTLINSYQALCRQTCKDFIWLIVDDGSTDNTRELIDLWSKENKIQIKYVYQENAGKQRAVNTGIDNCETEFFGFLDSDDYYCDNTVENFLSDFDRVKNNNRVAGILARRGKDQKTPMGSQNLSEGRFVDKFDHLIRKYNYSGDTCRAYYTRILKQYKYPIINDKFIPEDVMLSAIDQEYELLIVNQVYSISGYLEDGYTKNGHKLFHKNPTGFALGMAQLAISKRGILRHIKYTMMYTIWCMQKKINHPEQMIKCKLSYYLLYPVSSILYALKWPRWFFKEDI